MTADRPEAGPSIAKELASSDSCIGDRKRKRPNEFTKAEIIKMFSDMHKQQDDKMEALIAKVEGGIESHTEQNKNISDSIEILAQQCDEMANRIVLLEQEKASDRIYIQTLEAKLESMDRHLRCSSIEMRNVPKKAGETKEDLHSIVKKIGDVLNVPIQSSEVRDVYRINTKRETNQPIVAEFTTVAMRDRIIDCVKAYNKKYTTSKLSTQNLKLEGPSSPIFISESLTVQTKKLFYLAREFAKANNYRYCWASRGKIYLRRKDGASLIRVNNEENLANLKNK